MPIPDHFVLLHKRRRSTVCVCSNERQIQQMECIQYTVMCYGLLQMRSLTIWKISNFLQISDVSAQLVILRLTMQCNTSARGQSINIPL